MASECASINKKHKGKRRLLYGKKINCWYYTIIWALYQARFD